MSSFPSLKFAGMGLLATSGLLTAALLLPPEWTAQLGGLPAAIAQRIRTDDIPEQVYRQLPDLPLENQYVSLETGEVSSGNTLVSRLIRYHTFVKGRSPNFRLDWKLTLADYLNANERIAAASYPGADTLRTHPLEADREAIAQLNRRQRDQLVQILVNLHTRSRPSPPPASPPPLAPPPPAPRPGDAQLLL